MSGKITPCLWFPGNAREAVDFYMSVFPDVDSEVTARYPDGTPMAGQVLTIAFRIFNQEFVALNAGPEFAFTEAVSFQIACIDQEEVDYYWDRLTADGGEESMCGWLKDKFGMSWQVVPGQLVEMLSSGSPERAAAMTQALFQMKRIDIAALEKAYNGA